jgi:hypothetical protein
MKTNTKLLPTLIIMVAALSLFSCGEEFTGTVVNNFGTPVEGATVVINEIEMVTKKDGAFKLTVKKQTVDRYKVSVSKFGYGMFQRKFNTPFKERRIVLTQGTIASFEPNTDIEIRDSQAAESPLSSPLLQFDTTKLFKIVPKVYDQSGKLVNLGYPAETGNTLAYLRIPPVPSSGMQVSIPRGSIETVNNTDPVGKIDVSVSTVDLFNPDGMPGDYNVRLKNENESEYRLGSMDSYGAGSVEMKDANGTKCKLKSGATAKISIPIYPMVHKFARGNVPEKIPLLYFLEDEGVWEVQGEATINSAGDAYEAEVSHFSVINMDLVWVDPSCLKFRQIVGGTKRAGTYLPKYNVTVTVPQNTATMTAFKEKINIPISDVDTESDGCYPRTDNSIFTRLHPIINMPQNTWVTVIFSKPDNTPVDIAIIQTPPQVTNDSGSEAYACPMQSPPLACDQLGADTCGTCMGFTQCWLSECTYFPFENTTDDLKIAAYWDPSISKVRVKWLTNDPAACYFRIKDVTSTGGCGDAGVGGGNIICSQLTSASTACAGAFTCTANQVQPLFQDVFSVTSTAPGNTYTFKVFSFDSSDGSTTAASACVSVSF